MLRFWANAGDTVNKAAAMIKTDVFGTMAPMRSEDAYSCRIHASVEGDIAAVTATC
jgi:hypothetical protein